MLFHSTEFLVFFAVYLSIHFLLPPQHRLGLIVVGGMIFYSWWNPWYAWIPPALTLIAYGGALWLSAETRPVARRWKLAEIAAEVGGSPVYLTQVFQQVEGLPLYRYQLRLRLARSLDLLAQYDDLTALGLELGFSSHSHFSAAFRETYGRSPSEFRQSALHK